MFFDGENAISHACGIESPRFSSPPWPCADAAVLERTHEGITNTVGCAPPCRSPPTPSTASPLLASGQGLPRAYVQVERATEAAAKAGQLEAWLWARTQGCPLGTRRVNPVTGAGALPPRARLRQFGPAASPSPGDGAQFVQPRHHPESAGAYHIKQRH